MFRDIDVLDLTQSVAGPVCTENLGALGANVIKVEPPGGDKFRASIDGGIFAAVNLTKRSLSVDLKSPDGAQLVRDLATDVDVVVESFRPGVLEQYGLDYDSVSESNTDVVYCSITGFGQEGPFANRPAYDPVLQAMSGVMANTGYPDRQPVRIGTSAIDFSTGMTASFLVASAVRRRDSTGEGEYIDTSLYDVALRWMSGYVAKYTGSGEEPRRAGQTIHGLAPYGVFETQTDPVYIAAPTEHIFERLCSCLQKEELLEDARFQTRTDRWDNREDLRREIEPVLAEWDSDELIDHLTDSGVPIGPLQSIGDVVEEDPHVAARGQLTPSRNLHTETDVQTVSVPFHLSDTDTDWGDRPPELGEHTREILGEFGYSSLEIESLLEADAVFE